MCIDLSHGHVIVHKEVILLKAILVAFIVLLSISSCLATVEKSKSSSTVSVNGDITDNLITVDMLSESTAMGDNVDASVIAASDLAAGDDSSDIQMKATGKSKSMSVENNGVTIEKSQTQAVSKTTSEDGLSSGSNFVILGSSAGEADTSVAITSSTDGDSVDKAHEKEMIITFNNGANAGESKVKSNVEDDTVEITFTGDVFQATTSIAEADNGGTAHATGNSEVTASDNAFIYGETYSMAIATGDGSSADAVSTNKATAEDNAVINSQFAATLAIATGDSSSAVAIANSDATATDDAEIAQQYSVATADGLDGNGASGDSSSAVAIAGNDATATDDAYINQFSAAFTGAPGDSSSATATASNDATASDFATINPIAASAAFAEGDGSSADATASNDATASDFAVITQYAESQSFAISDTSSAISVANNDATGSDSDNIDQQEIDASTT